jgi:hypothetical protein
MLLKTVRVIQARCARCYQLPPRCTYSAWLPPGQQTLTVTATANGDKTQSRQVHLTGHAAGRPGFTLAAS